MSTSIDQDLSLRESFERPAASETTKPEDTKAQEIAQKSFAENSSSMNEYIERKELAREMKEIDFQSSKNSASEEAPIVSPGSKEQPVMSDGSINANMIGISAPTKEETVAATTTPAQKTAEKVQDAVNSDAVWASWIRTKIRALFG